MEATALGFTAASFDLVLLVFVLFHLPDPVGALREIAPVLRSPGWLALCTWGADQGLPGAEIWATELDAAGAPPDERPACVQQHTLMDSPEKLSGLLQAAGFEPVRLWTWRFERGWSAGELATLGARYGLQHRRLQRLPAAAADRCRARVAARLAALPADALQHRPQVVYGIATRPAAA